MTVNIANATAKRGRSGIVAAVAAEEPGATLAITTPPVPSLRAPP